MLCALVRQVRDASSPIFIDRDHHLFRWILQCYRNPLQTVPSKTVGVSESKWQTELDYYGVPTVEVEVEQEVEKEEERADLRDMQKRCRELETERDEQLKVVTVKSRKLFDYQRRKGLLTQKLAQAELEVKYAGIIGYMVDSVEKGEPGTFDFISIEVDSVCADKRCHVDPSFISGHSNAIREFARRSKLEIAFSSYQSGLRKQNYDYKPARLLGGGPKKAHSHMQLTLKILFQ